MHPTSWQDYWRSDNSWTNCALWAAGGRILSDYLDANDSPGPGDHVLTFGCGDGHAEALLAPRVKSVTACDISESAVCRTLERASGPNVRGIVLRPNHYEDIPADRRYTLFIAASTVQYLPDLNAVKTLLLRFARIAAPGARLVLTDLPEKGSLADFSRLFLHSFQKKFTGALLLTGMRLIVSRTAYRRAVQCLPTLYFTEEILQQLLKDTGLNNGRIFRGSTSVHPHRLNLSVVLP